ncbi:MAG: hypothetical protein O6857_07130 [Nitrospinae bacterium]|nr:hypothetical protein [Nitrospinota bacterium]
MGLLYKKGEPGKNCRKEIVSMSDERYIISFKAATGFHVVLEYPGLEELEAVQKKIEEAGLTCERWKGYSTQFDQADLYMDMRSPECIAQFDLDDWI